MPWLQVDDFRLALQLATTPITHSDLHFFIATPNVWSTPVAALADHLERVAEIVSASLEWVIEHYLVTPYPIILEGDGITPALAARWVFQEAEGKGRVTAVCLHDDDPNRLHANMLNRGRSFDRGHDAARTAQVQMNVLYSERLRRKSQNLGLPVLTVHPQETLVERAVGLLSH